MPHDTVDVSTVITSARVNSDHVLHQVADITFSLWYQLSECLYDNENELWEQFRPHVQELLAALCNHCKLDEKLPPVSC